MGRDARAGVLLLSVLLVVTGGYATRAREDARPPAASVITPASVTQPAPEDPVVVEAAASTNDRGWRTPAQSVSADTGVRSELMDAYDVAVALAPAQCHLSVSLLAAIGQVESGNLDGHAIEGRRAVPSVIGPVLDGKGYAAVADTDDGHWDGNRTWDRALGPLQFLPATWRVVGLDMDADGVRDPQNIYDAAGAAMVYLCDAGRDLGTQDGLAEAVLAYNHSRAYVRQVLAWKTIFDAADLMGVASQPTFGAWAAPVEPDPGTGTTASAATTRSSGVAQAAGAPGRPAKTSGAGATATPPTTAAPGATAPTGAAAPGTDAPTGKDPATVKTPAAGGSPAAGPGAPGTTTPASTPSERPSCVVVEPTPGADGTPGADPTPSADETAPVVEGTPLCCVLPDGTTVTPTPTPGATATVGPDGEILPDACLAATLLPAASAAPAG